MIREKRNREKLVLYYNKFVEDGIVDSNVHPWIAESWQRCRQLHLPHENVVPEIRINKEKFEQHMKKHAMILEYVDKLYEQTMQYLNMHNLSMLLTDEKGYVVKNYAKPFFQHSMDDISGIRVLEEDIGTSSISIALEHNIPFLIFGPEMWLSDCHCSNACSTPISVNGQLRYILTFSSLENDNLSYELLVNQLLTWKYAIEEHLTMLERCAANDILLGYLPAAIFWVDKRYEIKYCNEVATKRMGGKERLQDVFLNYKHLPLNEAFMGQETIRNEFTWITADRTYEDIISVIPMRVGADITGALIVSRSIEDIKNSLAHATTYSSRYSLHSMVGESPEFMQLQHKVMRIARYDDDLLLEGESGTGKQRLAHGIHQASSRAAYPLICVKCRDGNADEIREELFGNNEGKKKVTGKLELANDGTLFLDEVEKLSVEIGDEIANALANKKKCNTRLIVACDSCLKRLTDKGLFSQRLFDMVSDRAIKILPLRERTKDIEVIANHILMEMSVQHNLPIKRLSPEVLAKLTSYEWPGNIKQLQGVIERAFFHTTSDVIEEDSIILPDSIKMERAWKSNRDAFISAWKSAGGNISRLAIMLDVSRVTLYRYLRKYGLSK